VYAFLVANFIYRDMGPLRDRALVDRQVNPSGRNGYFAFVYALIALIVIMIVGFLLLFIATLSGVELIANAGRFLSGLDGLWMPVVPALACGAIYLMVKEKGRTALALVKSVPVFGKALFESAAYLPWAVVHKDTKDTLFEAGKLTIMLLFIIANALILKHVLTEEQIPQAITQAMLAAGLGPIMFLIVVNIILLIGGQFMEPSGLLIIVAPLVFPIAVELNIDPIHLGIIMVVNMEIGMITPPVGLNLFVTAGVAHMSVTNVVKAALPWVAIMLVFLILVTYVPIISTWLPTSMMGPEIITR